MIRALLKRIPKKRPPMVIRNSAIPWIPLTLSHCDTTMLTEIATTNVKVLGGFAITVYLYDRYTK